MAENTDPRSFVSLVLRHGGLGLVIPLVLAGIIGFIAKYTFQDASEFSARGQTTSAEIVSTQLQRSSGPGSGNSSAIPHATVRFSVDGEEISASSRISESLYESARQGDTLDIVYLPDAPRTIEIESGTNLNIALILFAVTGLVVGVWLWIAYRAFRFASSALHVRNNGVRRVVEVVEHQHPMFTNDKKPEVCLVWVDGSGRQARSLPTQPHKAKAFGVGKKIAIYEVPGSGLDSVWEGDVSSSKPM